MQTMIEIDDAIVSTDILTECFLCDLSVCHGECCVEGNAGAPLDEDELEVLEQQWDNYAPFMTKEGREVIEREGFFTVDCDGETVTPLVGEAECAYSFNEGGTTFCAIERAWKQGRTKFRKPVSCHLYPIRVSRFGNGTVGLNYHRWDICRVARECGVRRGVKVYEALREPIERAFGADFYHSLELAADYINNNRTE